MYGKLDLSGACLTAIFVTASLIVALGLGASHARADDSHMDIPAGLTLVDLLPHMHYLGKEVIATATLPSGETIPLIHIEK